MGVQSFLKTAFKASLAAMEAEDVSFGSTVIKAVIDMPSNERFAGQGADEVRREIVITFPADLLSKPPKSGSKFTARGKEWQVELVRAGLASIEVRGVEPEKRNR
jgi:hypothetical protein